MLVWTILSNKYKYKPQFWPKLQISLKVTVFILKKADLTLKPYYLIWDSSWYTRSHNNGNQFKSKDWAGFEKGEDIF